MREYTFHLLSGPPLTVKGWLIINDREYRVCRDGYPTFAIPKHNLEYYSERTP